VRGAGTLITGRIATLAGRHGPGWVEAIAVEHGRVVAAGRLADVESALPQGSRRLRLAPGEVAIPGLTDAHLHLAEAALSRRRVSLDDARSIGDVIERVRAAAAARPDAGTWTSLVAGRPRTTWRSPPRAAWSPCGRMTTTRSS
jgi:predicted amidohydrolase YtcJ